MENKETFQQPGSMIEQGDEGLAGNEYYAFVRRQVIEEITGNVMVVACLIGIPFVVADVFRKYGIYFGIASIIALWPFWMGALLHRRKQ